MSYQSPATFRTYSLCSGSFNGIPDNVVQTYLDVAQCDIDSALSIHMGVPGQPIFASGSMVPASVLEAERVLTAYRLFMALGITPGDNMGFLTQRYEDIWGTKELGPGSGWLGQLAAGTRRLVDPNNNDQPEVPTQPSFFIVGGAPRQWQQPCNGPQAGTFVR